MEGSRIKQFLARVKKFVIAPPPPPRAQAPEILFTTPTIENTQPSESGWDLARDDCHRMQEDEWRQFEFVSSSHEAAIAAELAAIDLIWRDQSVPVDEHSAFRNTHVRRLVVQPLDIPFSASDLASLFEGEPVPITFDGWESVLRDVCAVRTGNMVAYAVIVEGRMTVLGLDSTGPIGISSVVADRLVEFVTKHRLQLIHWRSRTRFASPEAVSKYLNGPPPTNG